MKKPLAVQLGEILTKARGPRSRRSLARHLMVNERTLSDLENGKANPTLARIERVAADYGVEIEINATSKERTLVDDRQRHGTPSGPT